MGEMRSQAREREGNGGTGRTWNKAIMCHTATISHLRRPQRQFKIACPYNIHHSAIEIFSLPKSKQCCLGKGAGWAGSLVIWKKKKCCLAELAVSFILFCWFWCVRLCFVLGPALFCLSKWANARGLVAHIYIYIAHTNLRIPHERQMRKMKSNFGKECATVNRRPTNIGNV